MGDIEFSLEGNTEEKIGTMATTLILHPLILLGFTPCMIPYTLSQELIVL
jgi:hypothetical protein